MCLGWHSGESKTVNGNSVVARLDYKDVRLLLSGDINHKASKTFLKKPGFAPGLDAHMLKAPHHGSHEFSKAFLEAVNPQMTFISSGDSVNGHPRANFLGTVGLCSRSDQPLMFSTELVIDYQYDEDMSTADPDEPGDPADANSVGQARQYFKKRLNGLINVRTDGRKIFAYRRIPHKKLQYVVYGQLSPTARKF